MSQGLSTSPLYYLGIDMVSSDCSNPTENCTESTACTYKSPLLLLTVGIVYNYYNNCRFVPLFNNLFTTLHEQCIISGAKAGVRVYERQCSWCKRESAYSSVGRAGDCRWLQLISLGHWFDSGCADFFRVFLVRFIFFPIC